MPLEISRNDPCPCGSGQKYKKCCADKPLTGTVFHSQAASRGASIPAEQMKILKEGGHWLDNGDNIRALQLVTQVHERFPDNEDALFICGTALARMGRFAEAVPLLEKAIDKHPHMTRSYIMLAGTFHLLHNSKGMLEVMKRAIDMEKSALTHQWYAFATMADGQMDEAITHYRQAIALSQGANPEAMDMLYAALKRAGQFDEADQVLRDLLAVNPASTAQLSALFMFPEVAVSKAQMLEIRARIERDLDTLTLAPPSLNFPDVTLRMSAFYLAFQGLNDRPIMEKTCAVLRKASPEINFVATHCKAWRGVEGRKIRLGVVSQYFYNHSVGSMSQLFTALQPHGFEIHAFNFGGKADSSRTDFARICASFTELPPAVNEAKDTIASKGLDILLYPDVGMNTFSYILPFYRLAPVQCVLPGHPVTTGIDTMDYFISSELFEPEDAQEHYSETLVTLKHFAGRRERPPLPASWQTKAQAGLPEKGRIYFCPMTLYKIHPDFDEAIAAILKKDDEARVVFVTPKAQAHMADVMKARFHALMGPLASRIVFIPWLESDAYMSALHHADVILDPFHFGGGTTFFLMIAAGAPFVTLPGKLMRGLVGRSVALQIQMPELIAEDLEDYVAKAVAIASDPARRKTLRKKMLANADAVFGDTGSTAELAALLSDMVRKHAAKEAAAC